MFAACKVQFKTIFEEGIEKMGERNIQLSSKDCSVHQLIVM